MAKFRYLTGRVGRSRGGPGCEFPIWTREAVAIILMVILVGAILFLTGSLMHPVFRSCPPYGLAHHTC